MDETNCRAMILSRRKGDFLRTHHPEIADLWRQGQTEEEIGKKYLHNVTKSVARNAVSHALEFLVNPDERSQIAAKHCKQGSKKVGRMAAKLGEARGYYAWDILTPEKLTERRHKAGVNGGKISGKICYKNGSGIFAFTREERQRISREAIAKRDPRELKAHGINLARLNGFVPYDADKRRTEYGSLSEKDYILALRKPANLSWREIADRVNQTFPYNRNPQSLVAAYYHWTKKRIKVTLQIEHLALAPNS